MLRRSVLQNTWYKLQKRTLCKNVRGTDSDVEKHELAKIRNIGILAHIDAGKTTTTERMLYYSGTIRNMGEVHHGNTVTDYMMQERERGITITSASVTFNWKDYRFNLIDTPGHIDFTMEIEQTLNVLDGTIVVVDGSAGVEAQTLTVWKQANRYNIPRIIYVNKMDRLDANFEMSVNSIESKLDTVTLPTQFPIQDKSGLVGIIDVLTLEILTFNKRNQGKGFERIPLMEAENGKMWQIANEKRRLLTDKLSSLDDKLADIVIEQESLDKIPTKILIESLYRCTVNKKGVPVLLGSSYKNIGVQLLMDGVILYLPSPEENRETRQYSCFEDNLSARAFKIIHDRQRGPITFFRIYTGKFKQGQKMYNVRQEITEQSGRLYVAYADDYQEVQEMGCGNIAAVAGLKSTITGDLITSNATAVNKAKKIMQKHTDTQDTENLFTINAKIPDPVFFCSIEPPSLAYQNALDNALRELEREDPSLRVHQDEDTDQIILAGMGELHLDIIKERIRTEYKIDVDLGPLQIAYKETIQNSIKDTYVLQHKIGNSDHYVTVTLSLIPNYEGNEILLLDKSQESAANVTNIHPKVMKAVKNGITYALSHGTKLRCPVINVGVKLHWLQVKKGTSDSMVSAAVTQCIQKLLQESNAMILEPIMQLEIISFTDNVSKIIGDLSRRRAEIQHITMRGKNKVINSLTPLSELMGYSTTLRILTSGNATFSLEFSHYQSMRPTEEQEAVTRITGV